jgi:aryl-alcohol dehydrogenase-like predicted oxidoreductase
MTPSRLTLGTAQLGMAYGVANTVGRLSADQVLRVLDAALEHGIRCLDTAPAYGDAEERIGAWRRARSHPDVALATKLGRLPTDLAPRDLARHVRASVEASRARLAADRVDFLLLHAAADLERFGAALVAALAEAVAAGLAGRIGVSAYTPEEVDRALEQEEFSVVQVPLHLLDRRLVESGRLARLEMRGFTVFARSPYLQGLFALAPSQLPARVAHAAPWLERLLAATRRHGLAAVDCAVAWAAAQPGVTSVVVGAESAEQVEANARAVSAPLPAGLDADLSALGEAPLDVIDPSRWPT